MRSEFRTSILEHDRFMVVLWLHTEVEPPATEWASTVKRLGELRRTQKLPVSLIRQLVVSDGGGPGAVQRQQILDDFHDGMPSPVAVITHVLSNPVKRGMATALTWINPHVRFYEPSEFSKALEYLELTQSRKAIWREFHRLEGQLKPARALRLMKRQALHESS